MSRMLLNSRFPLLKMPVICFLLSLSPLCFAQSFPSDPESANRVEKIVNSALAPVYAPLAEWITSRFDLSENEGVGLDIGGGPGSLLVALSRLTPRMHWINADINPATVPLAVKRADEQGVAGRVSAIVADVHALPFREGYADVIVSRGSFQQWENLEQGLSEIYRVLKPGGTAFIGRGFSPNLPPEIARQVRDGQRGGGFEPSYDLGQTAAEFAAIMKALRITDYEIHLPRPEGSEGILYGIWLEFHKGRRPARSRGESPARAVSATHGAPLPVLDTVEVSARRARNPIAEPLVETVGLETSVSEVSSTEITKQGAKSVVDALAYTPGAWTETRGRKVKQFVSFRGQTYPYPEYAIAGALFREFHELPYFFSANDIERIEIMRSSASLLTGISGLAGVINIVPRTYIGPETSWGVDYGSFGTTRALLAHGNGDERFSYGVRLDVPRTEGPEGRYAAENVSNSSLTLHWLPRENVAVEAGLFHLFGEHRLTQALSPAQPRLQSAMERYDPIHAAAAFLKTAMRHDASATTEAIFSWSNRDNDFVAQTETSSATAREWDFEYTANIIHSRALTSRNTLRVGGYYNRWVAPQGKRFYAGRRCDLETFSGAAVNEYRIGRLALDGGVQVKRTYIHDYGGFNIDGSAAGFGPVTPIADQWESPAVNASFGAAYHLRPDISFHGNSAYGMVEPRRGTLDADGKEPDAERRLKMDAGVRLARPEFGSVVITGFLVRQDDAIVLTGNTATVNDRVLELYENRDQRQAGVELEYLSPMVRDAVRFFATGVAMRSRAERNGAMRTNREAPQVIASGGAYFTWRGFDANAFWKFVSNYESARFAAPGQGPQPLGDFHDITFTGGYSFGAERKSRVYLEARNLLDNRYSTVVGYPDFGRRYTAGFRQAF